jgi:DNA-binding CsgD family transcriptional regulator
MQRLVGRHDELETLINVLRVTEAGATNFTLILGEAGIGKTALVEASLHVASFPTNTMRIFNGAASQLDGRAFAALLAAFDIRLTNGFSQREADRPESEGVVAAKLHIIKLLRQLDRGSTPVILAAVPELRHQIIDGLIELAEQQLQMGPMVVVLEDIHWADRSTILAVISMLRRLSGYHLGIVVTARPQLTATPDYLRLHRLAQEVIRLNPLTAQDCADFVINRFGRPAGPRLNRLVVATGGNALLLSELLGDVDDAQWHIDSRGCAELPAAYLPVTLAARIDAKLHSLPAPVAEVVRVASVIGQRSSVEQIAAILDVPVSRVFTSVDLALRSDLLRENDGGLEFRHELIRQAVEESTPSVIRTALHREVAKLLIEQRQSPSEIVEHIDRGGRATTTDRELLRTWLIKAGEEALYRLPGASFEYLKRARSTMDEHDPEWAQLGALQIEAAVNNGKMFDAEHLAAELLSRPLELEIAARVRWWLGGALFLTHRSAEAAELLELAAHDVSPYDRPIVLVYAAMMSIASFESTCEASVQRAIEAADASGRMDAIALAYFVKSQLCTMRLDMAGGLRAAQHAMTVGEADQTAEALRNQPHFFLALAYLDAAQVDKAIATSAHGRSLAVAQGVFWAEALFLGLNALLFMIAGRLDEAEADALAGIEAASEIGAIPAILWCHVVMVVQSLSRGDLTAASEWMAEADSVIATGQVKVGLELLERTRASVMEHTGDVIGAQKHLAALWELFRDLGVPNAQSQLAFELARLSRTTGDSATLVSVVETTKQWSLQDPSEWLGTLSVAVKAASTDDRLLAAEAVARYRAIDHHWDANCVNQAFGLEPQLTPGAGNQTRASEPETMADAASRIYANLTAAEKRVAQLVAEGCTNKRAAEILSLSTRTIETHVAKVMQKLGVSSRVKVALLLRDQRDSI